MKNSIFILLVPVLFILISCQEQDNSKPNILFLMCDEMRWDCMGVSGHPVVQTPYLDGLAREGFHFPRAYSPHPVCVPARITLFTSRYGTVTEVMNNNHSAASGEFYLPSILQHYGYSTCISGKLHFNPVGSAYGFDELMLDLLEKKYPVHTYSHNGYWLDIGRLEDYERANSEIDIVRNLFG